MPLSRLLLLWLATGCAPSPEDTAPTSQGLHTSGSTPNDADGDGYPAEIDCDDSDPDIHPLQPDACDNRIDDNCNGLADEGCPPEDTATPPRDTGEEEEEEQESGQEKSVDFSMFEEGSVIITELMINPAVLPDPEGEWLEVHNRTAHTLSLEGLTLEVDGLRQVLWGVGEVAAGGVAVLATPSLQNEGGTLRLWAGDRLLDEVRWTEDEVPSGASWSLDPLAWAAEGRGSAWWCAAEARWGARTDRGSPGEINGGCPAYDHDGDGFSREQGDCDDEDGAISPGAEEIWYDGVDQDCDGWSDDDADRDGFSLGEDCDDADAAVHPLAEEVCNGVDDDCDGTADLGAVDAAWWFADRDGDGHGDPGAATWACEAPEGHVADKSDCDDADAAANPSEVEVCGNDTDEDCDSGAALCDEVAHPFGGAVSSWTTSKYYRGNLYEAAEDGTLLRFAQQLDLPSAGCDVDFYVFQASTTAGPWSLAWTDTVHASSSGFLSSGTIDLETQAGQVYGLGVGWRCKATYYGEYGSFLGEDGGVGAFAGTHYDNAYTGTGTGSSYVPASTGAGSLAYAQVIYMAAEEEAGE